MVIRMDNERVELEPLLRALVYGRDTAPSVDDFITDQLYKVACRILSVANKTKSDDAKLSMNLSYQNRHCDETDRLLRVFANTVSEHLSKMLEIPLFGTIARLYQVPDAHYGVLGMPEKPEEAVFYFVNRQGVKLTCEFQFSNMMEFKCADGAFSRDSTIVFIDTRSKAVKHQLHYQRKHWVELGATDGYKRIFTVFSYLDIPCVEFDGDLNAALDDIIPSVFEELA